MNSTTHWDSYWLATSSLNSFGEGKAASGYQGELLTFWNNCFALLKVNATVVDVGTGNGAIAVAARKYSDSKQLGYNIFGTDAAKINPLQVFATNPQLSEILKTIQFYPQCKIEKLPFADASVDLITSQFAFEYAERRPALSECLRVLKPAGYFTAIMHHASSEIARDSAAGQRVLSLFLEKTEFFQHARALLNGMAEQTGNSKNAALLDQIRHANQKLLSIAQQIKLMVPVTDIHWFNDVMARVAKLITHFSALSIIKLDAEQQNLAAFRQRLGDQQQASITPEAAQTLRRQLTTAGLHFQLSELHIEDKLFGWTLTIQK